MGALQKPCTAAQHEVYQQITSLEVMPAVPRCHSSTFLAVSFHVLTPMLYPPAHAGTPQAVQHCLP